MKMAHFHKQGDLINVYEKVKGRKAIENVVILEEESLLRGVSQFCNNNEENKFCLIRAHHVCPMCIK